jgi:excisionase family DNA binding protein
MENLLQFKPGFKGNYAFIRKEEAIEHTESDHLANNRLLELFSKIKMGDPKAVETLSVRFIRLVINIADDFKGNGLTDLELVLNGNAGLIKAAEKFDISRGIDFEAYAIWSVRLRIPEVAKELGIARSNAYALARQGLLPTVHIGKAVRVPRRALLDWIEERARAESGGRCT